MEKKVDYSQSESLILSIPWTSQSYMPCNGFHPLYEALFEHNDFKIRFNVLDEFNFVKELLDHKYQKKILDEVGRFRDEIDNFILDDVYTKKFVDYISYDDLWLTDTLCGDIEFHHTSPLTIAKKPFIFHCESFLPIFMPFAFQGKGRITEVIKVRELYESIFSHPNCLGIYSHLDITLEQISSFFKNPVIDKKLKRTRVGLATNVLEHLSEVHERNTSNVTKFLFTSSAHQQTSVFKLRGGYSVLIFAEMFLTGGNAGEFVFRCPKPDDDELKKHQINLIWLADAEKKGQIIWIEKYLPLEEQLSLFKVSDFYLLPSLNLHSVSIMQSQVAGAIPVVTDTSGTSTFVKNEQTGIILEGVRATVWKSDSQNYEYDDHSLLSQELIKSLSNQMMVRVSALISDRSRLNKLRIDTKDYARVEYEATAFKDSIFEHLCSFVNRNSMLVKKRKINSKISLPLLGDGASSISRMFLMPPVPKIVKDFNYSRCYMLRGNYWLRSKSLYDSSWGVLHSARSCHFEMQLVKVFRSLDEVEKDLNSFEPTLKLKLLVKVRELADKYPSIKKQLITLRKYL